MCRRKSPSVMMPARRPLPSTTPRQPKAFSVMTTMASAIMASARGKRQAIAPMHQIAHEFQPRAELAAGMQEL